MQVKRTYSSRQKNTASPQKSTTSCSPTAPTQWKRPLAEVLVPNHSVPPALKRRKIAAKLRTDSTLKPRQKTLTQLHFSIDQTTLRNCPLCDLSYTRGAPEDEALHRVHCPRVQRGMEWGKEEERESAKVGVIQVASQVKLKDGKKGRIISCPANCTGKIGSKITALLQTINLSLSSPPLPYGSLRDSKIYLFLLPQISKKIGSAREKIAGCVVAQRISNAMAIASNSENTTMNCAPQSLVAVDSGAGLFCHPQLLSTPMGIPRLFVPSAYRRQGIASAILTAAAATFIYGCPLDPRQGQIAFTQPTGDGRALMVTWGAGEVRIYEE